MSTGNTDRMRTEIEKACAGVDELYPGYRKALVDAALECISATAEHDDRRVYINQRFDTQIQTIATQVEVAKGGGSN